MAMVEVDEPRPLTIEDIVGAARALSGFTPEELIAGGRREPLVWWRMATIAVARIELGWSYATLGEYFGGRHFSTALSAVRKCRVDPELAGCVQRIRAQAGAPSRGRGWLYVIDGGAA